MHILSLLLSSRPSLSHAYQARGDRVLLTVALQQSCQCATSGHPGDTTVSTDAEHPTAVQKEEFSQLQYR